MLVAVLGASANPERYSYKAAKQLAAHGHQPIGVSPSKPSIANVEVVATLDELPPHVHTLTVYVAPERSSQMLEAIVQYGFARVIFNPGSENPKLAAQLRKTETSVVEACTLVMLATGQF